MVLWYLDSGCSKHMTGDASKKFSITLKQEGHVTYGDNKKGKILGNGTIGNENNFLIHDVLYSALVSFVTEATKSIQN